MLAGAPIDTDAGNGPIKRMVHASPMSFYEELVALGGGLMKGKFMLQGWKNMHPEQHYFQDHIDLYEHIDDPVYLAKEETFESWYENPIDLPGRWYLQVIKQLFKENRLAKGTFVGLGRRLNLKDITCPVYLLAGEADDITTQGAGLRRREISRHAEGQDREEARSGRPYRAVHGLAHSARDLAGDRQVDRPSSMRRNSMRRSPRLCSNRLKCEQWSGATLFGLAAPPPITLSWRKDCYVEVGANGLWG